MKLKVLNFKTSALILNFLTSHNAIFHVISTLKSQNKETRQNCSSAFLHARTSRKFMLKHSKRVKVFIQKKENETFFQCLDVNIHNGVCFSFNTHEHIRELSCSNIFAYVYVSQHSMFQFFFFSSFFSHLTYFKIVMTMDVLTSKSRCRNGYFAINCAVFVFKL